MTKIDIDKFVASLIEFSPQQSMKYIKALADQGLKYKDGEIVEIPQESEDEKIRKYFIAKFKKMLEEDNLQPLGTVDASKLLAWLEQQSKKKNEAEKGGELRKWLDFGKTHEGTTITITKDLKGTDTDGGVVGEKGEQPTEAEMVGMGELEKAWFEKELLDHIDDVARRLHPLYSLLGHFITDYNKKTDKVISLLQSAILPIPRETYVPPIIKNPLDPDPNTLGGWETTASTEGGEE